MNRVTVRRSPIHRALAELNPVWGEIHGMSVVLRIAEPADEKKLGSQLALCDMSYLHKVAFKGAGIAEWLSQMGIPTPEEVYNYSVFKNGLVVRTDRNEFFVEDGPRGEILIDDIVRSKASLPPGVQRVHRQDASFLLCGADCQRVLRETCGVDFTTPLNGVVMTRVAGVSCMVLPLQGIEMPAVRLWLDPSYGIYLWKSLLEIVRAYGGNAIGLMALYSIDGSANLTQGRNTHDS
jgi:sarcosine oxidase subunit gamma